MTIIPALTKLRQGQSYWRIELTSGKIVSEGQIADSLTLGWHSVDWLHDVIACGDNAYIKTITLCTPEGEWSLSVFDPYTAFQFKCGTFLWSGERIMQYHIIGVVTEKETGECISAIWDVAGEPQLDGRIRHLYTNHKTTVRDFGPWRTGVARIGALGYEVVGLGPVAREYGW